MSSSPSTPSLAAGKDALPIVVKPRSPLSLSRSIFYSPCRRFLLLISSTIVQQINGNATVSSPALGRALRDAVVTSSPFPSFWTKSSRATTPPVSPHHHDQKPSRTVENEASWTEIGIIFSNSDCRLPLLIPPPPILESFDLSPSSRRFLPRPPMSIHRQVLVAPLQATVNLQ